MTTDELLDKMATVLCYGMLWNARAKGSTKFAVGATHREAMENALRVNECQVESIEPAMPSDDLF